MKFSHDLALIVVKLVSLECYGEFVSLTSVIVSFFAAVCCNEFVSPKRCRECVSQKVIVGTGRLSHQSA